jgi:hypothetical protein
MPLDGEYLDLPGDLNIAGKLGVSWSNFNISDSWEKDLAKFALNLSHSLPKELNS